MRSPACRQHADGRAAHHSYNVRRSRKVKMTEEEIKAKKFAMESAKDNAAEEAKE